MAPINMEAEVIKSLVTASPVVAVLIWVVLNQTKSNDKLSSAIAGVQDKRFDEMKSQIGELRERADACEADRRKILGEIAKLKNGQS